MTIHLIHLSDFSAPTVEPLYRLAKGLFFILLFLFLTATFIGITVLSIVHVIFSALLKPLRSLLP